VGDSFQDFWAKIERHRAERELQKKAEWEALPDDAKQSIRLAEEIERHKREWQEARERQERQLSEWRRRGVTPRFYGATWENWRAELPEQKHALEQVKQAWGKNLFISGGNGTGKTHLAMCLAKDGGTYRVLPDLFREVRENQELEQGVINKYGSCKLLILDEVGRQKGTEFERNLLFEIIDRRWNNLLPTTIIGNITQNEFADLCGGAILDRLRPVVIKFGWGSSRE